MEIVVRVLVIYVFILVGLRLLGKREFGQLSPVELVTLLIIPEIVSQALTNEDRSVTGALIGTSTLLLLVFLTSTLVHLSKRADEVIGGIPTVLVQDGRCIESAMNKERVSPDELFSELHKAGLERLEQVRWAILQPDGKIAIIPQEQPLPVQHEEKNFIG